VKKITLIGGLIFFQSVFVNISAININGVEKRIDTLEHRQVGPGVLYTRFQLPDYPLSAYILQVNLNNPYSFIETFQAGNQVGKTEAMTTAYNRLKSTAHSTIAGVNGNFWIVSGQGQPTELLGVPHSGSMLGGEMITDPNSWNRGHGSIGFAMIDANKKAWIDDIVFTGEVNIPNKGGYAISQINRMRGDNELVLFNNYLGVGKTTRTDNNGIEVFIKPANNGQWSTNENVNCVVTRIIANQGGNLLEEGESVLSGSGTAQTFLSGLNPGDTLSVNMSIKTQTDNQQPKVNEMITGNALVMKNGVLTNRNTNEAYNSQLYPRTGIGTSTDGKTLYLIVIDKKGTSIGANTATMCGILKAFGATDVTTMDGGGSAQMMLEGTIVNNPADGKERPVANGWFVYHNAPEDNNITQLAFEDLRTEMPALASYKPVILGYNQYGVLINKNVENYTLTCSDGLGEITPDGAFIANGTATSGILTVSYNQVSISKTIRIISGDIAFRLDSVLIDEQRSYPIEVFSISASGTLTIPPALLNWSIEDESICKIENGNLKGLKNGKTKIYGTIGEVKDSLTVYVEIPEQVKMIYDDFSQTGNPWKLSASSQLSATLSSSGIPLNWSSGLAVNFTYNAGRAPFMKLTNQKPLYALPDSISIVINTGDMLIDRALISLRANNSKQTISKEFNAFVGGGGDTEIKYAISDFFDTNDIAVFPVWLDNFNFYLQAMTENQAYQLAFKEINLTYNGREFSGTHIPLYKSGFSIYPNPVNGSVINIHFDEYAGIIDYNIFNLYGQKIISKQSVYVNGNHFSIPSKELMPGYYLLTINNNRSYRTLKFIKK
jgi:hypothetical protein